MSSAIHRLHDSIFVAVNLGLRPKCKCKCPNTCPDKDTAISNFNDTVFTNAVAIASDIFYADNENCATQENRRTHELKGDGFGYQHKTMVVSIKIITLGMASW